MLRLSSREVVAIVGLTVLAAALRLPLITDVPPGLQGDEAWLGIEAKRILEDGPIGIWTAAGWGQPTGVFYWTALAFAALPDTVLVLRSSIAVLGIATVPIFYLFMRSLFGVRPALIATFLLAVSHWHIHYSRTAYTLIAAPLVASAAMLLLARAVQTRRASLFFASGIVTGLGVYTYRGYVLFLVVVGIVWLKWLLAGRPGRPASVSDGGPSFPVVRSFLAFWVPAALVAAPMALFIVADFDTYISYGEISSVFGSHWQEQHAADRTAIEIGAYKVLRAVGIYYVGRGPDATDGLGAIGLLDPAAAVLFTVGLVLSLRRWRDWRYLSIALGVFAGVAVVATTAVWGENRRGIVALPMVFAAAGVGGDYLVRAASRWAPPVRRAVSRSAVAGRLGRASRRLVASFRSASVANLRPRVRLSAAVVLAFTVGAFSVGWNTWHYFGRIATGDDVRFAYAAELNEACTFLASLPDTTHVYFYSSRWTFRYEACRFVAPGIRGQDRSTEFGRFGLDWDPRYPQVAYLLLPPYTAHLDDLREIYPGGEVVERVDGNRLVFVAYLLDRSTAQVRTGGEAAGVPVAASRLLR